MRGIPNYLIEQPLKQLLHLAKLGIVAQGVYAPPNRFFGGRQRFPRSKEANQVTSDLKLPIVPRLRPRRPRLRPGVGFFLLLLPDFEAQLIVLLQPWVGRKHIGMPCVEKILRQCFRRQAEVQRH